MDTKEDNIEDAIMHDAVESTPKKKTPTPNGKNVAIMSPPIGVVLPEVKLLF